MKKQAVKVELSQYKNIATLTLTFSKEFDVLEAEKLSEKTVQITLKRKKVS